MIGNPDIVDATVELIYPRRPRTLADLYVECRFLLCCGNRAEKLSVVELTVKIDVQGLRRRIVDAGNVIPGVGLQRRRTVAEHGSAGTVGEFESDRATTRIDRGVELEAETARVSVGNHRRIIARK